jgi:hypothetical protein
MTAMFVSVAEVRAYLSLNAPGTDSKYSDATISSNIMSAGWTLERACGRLFGDVTATKKFSTDGRAQMYIPGLRTATSVTLQGTTLTADTTYWLLPDDQQTGVYTGIQFRAFRGPSSGGRWWLGNPEWFDRNLDSPFYPGNYGLGGTLPNDLVIAGDWGYSTIPDPVLLATKALAAWYTLRPDALLSGARFTPDGNIFDLSKYPTEVQAFITDWKTGEQAVLV